jgi:hypothetical protein
MQDSGNNLTALYIKRPKGYIPPYNIEKNYLIAIQKRNLLLRRDFPQSTNLNRRFQMNVDESTRIKEFRPPYQYHLNIRMEIQHG